MTEMIDELRMRSTKWADVLKWLKGKNNIDPRPVSRACARSHGRNRVGFSAVVYAPRDPRDLYVVTPHPDGYVLKNHVDVGPVRASYFLGTPTKPNSAVDCFAMYSARSSHGVEFRASVRPWVDDGRGDGRADGIGVRLVHTDRKSTVTVLTEVADGSELYRFRLWASKVIPWITDYHLAERLTTTDAESWIEAKKHIDLAPKWVRQAADEVYAIVAKQTNETAVKNIKF